MPYEDADEAVALVARGGGGLVASVYGDDRKLLPKLILGVAPYHGRVLLGSKKVADQAIRARARAALAVCTVGRVAPAAARSSAASGACASTCSAAPCRAIARCSTRSSAEDTTAPLAPLPPGPIGGVPCGRAPLECSGQRRFFGMAMPNERMRSRSVEALTPRSSAAPPRPATLYSARSSAATRLALSCARSSASRPDCTRRWRRRLGRARWQREIEPQRGCRGEDHGTLDDVGQLPHVAGPAVGLEQPAVFVAQREVRSRGLAGDPSEQRAGDRHDVGDPLAQRWYRHREHAEPVVEVAPEAPLLHVLLEVAIGCGDDPHVDLSHAVVADPLDLALLQDPQQLRLELDRDLAHLVQEERPPVRLLEATGPVPVRAGECASHVAEELALEELRRHGGTVHLHQWRVGARAARVDGAGDQLLAHARLAANQDGRRRRRHGVEGLEHPPHLRARRDHRCDVVAEVDLFAQVVAFDLGSPLEARELLERLGACQLRVSSPEGVREELADHCAAPLEGVPDRPLCAGEEPEHRTAAAVLPDHHHHRERDACALPVGAKLPVARKVGDVDSAQRAREHRARSRAHLVERPVYAARERGRRARLVGELEGPVLGVDVDRHRPHQPEVLAQSVQCPVDRGVGRVRRRVDQRGRHGGQELIRGGDLPASRPRAARAPWRWRTLGRRAARVPGTWVTRAGRCGASPGRWRRSDASRPSRGRSSARAPRPPPVISARRGRRAGARWCRRPPTLPPPACGRRTRRRCGSGPGGGRVSTPRARTTRVRACPRRPRRCSTGRCVRPRGLRPACRARARSPPPARPRRGRAARRRFRTGAARTPAGPRSPVRSGGGAWRCRSARPSAALARRRRASAGAGGSATRP